MHDDAPEAIRGATLVTQTKIRSGGDEEFAAWQRRMSVLVSEAPGFVSQEVIPADPPMQPDWTIIQRFESRDDASVWLASEARATMVEEIGDLLEGADDISVMEQPGPSRKGGTAVIRATVAPGREDAYRHWQAEIQSAQAKMPGFVGCAVQEPIAGVQDKWVTLPPFDSTQHLDAWLDSDRRAGLVRKAVEVVDADEVRRVESGFEGWFDFDRAAGVTAPPAWKFNYLILLGLYPIVMLEVLFLNAKLDWMNVAAATLIGNIFSIAFLGWPVVPILELMGWWIQRAPEPRNGTT